MQTIPIQPIPSQTVQANLGGQNVTINIYQKDENVFVDVIADAVTTVTAVIARDAVPIVCIGYLGFIGNLMFIDTQGANDPQYSGMGTRWQLVYLTADEYAIVKQ